MTPAQYNRINDLLSLFSAINAQLEAAEAKIKIVQLEAAAELLPQHAELKVKLTAIEDDLRKLSDAHYEELFPEDKKRSHKTPFGELKYHKSSSLEFDDVEKVMLKIERACEKELASALERADGPPRFTRDQLIRTREEPNLDAMGNFDDATLALFGITRAHKDNFSIKPFDMRTDKPTKRKELKAA